MFSNHASMPSALCGPNRSRRHGLAVLAALALLQACGKRQGSAKAVAPGATVLALGDSLTSGEGASPDEAYPVVLQELTRWQVVNGGVSGDTSAQALARLPELLQAHRPALVIVSIGGNDFLRQMSAGKTKDHIRAICRQCTEAGAQVMLVAIPGASLLTASTGRFADHPLYAELASELQLPLHAGGWSSVLSDASLRADQIHANAGGYRQFAQGLAAQLRKTGLLA